MPLDPDAAAPSADAPPAPRVVRFGLTEADLVAAYRLQSYVRLWSVQSAISVAVAFAILAVLVALGMRDGPIGWIVAVFGCGALGGLIVPLAMIRRRIPPLARRIFRQQRGLQGEAVLEWDAQGVRATTEHGHGRLAWRDYTRWREDRHIALLFQSDAIFQMLPKRALSPTELDEIRSHLSDAGVKGAQRRPG